jgi:hypothetical protein
MLVVNYVTCSTLLNRCLKPEIKLLVTTEEVEFVRRKENKTKPQMG